MAATKGRTMPETTPKAPKETWIDWMPENAPDPGILSFPELINELRQQGVDTASSGLEYYRKIGVLPRPVRRRYEGVTQAVYPSWFIPAIKHLRQLQGQGKSLEEIKPYMRSWALSTVQWRDPLAAPLNALDGNLRSFARHAAAMLGLAGELNTITVTFTNHDGDEVYRHEIPVVD
jgi:DNA-binding transcriptional MerR regulator